MTRKGTKRKWVDIGVIPSGMPDAPHGPCQNCEKRPATVFWVGEGSTMDFIHGNYKMWCDLCANRAALAHCRKEAERIPGLEAEVARLEAEEKERGE